MPAFKSPSRPACPHPTPCCCHGHSVCKPASRPAASHTDIMALRQLATTAFRTWGLCPAAGASPAIGASLSRAFATGAALSLDPTPNQYDLLHCCVPATERTVALAARVALCVGQSMRAYVRAPNVVTFEHPRHAARIQCCQTCGLRQPTSTSSLPSTWWSISLSNTAMPIWPTRCLTFYQWNEPPVASR